MLDIAGTTTVPGLGGIFHSGAADESTGSPELTLLSRQTHALEYIITQLGLLNSRVGQTSGYPIELQPEYELATRRLLQEAV